MPPRDEVADGMRGEGAVCERCGRPKARDIQDAVDHHFGPGICCDVQGSPAGQLGCRDRAIERKNAVIRQREQEHLEACAELDEANARVASLLRELTEAHEELGALADHIADLERRNGAYQPLNQVALEAVRLVYHDDGDRCGECGLLGAGALKDALKKLLGPEPWKLIWGNDANIDREAWDRAVASGGAVGDGKETT